MGMKRLGLWAALCGFVLTAGCGEKSYPELATPSGTLQTYLGQSSALISTVDPASYFKALSCFSADDRQWFEENFSSLPVEKDDSYALMNAVQKKAFVFGEAVVKTGPPAGIIHEEEVNDSTAVLSVEGYPQPIRLVKEGPNWRIKGFFGIR